MSRLDCGDHQVTRPMGELCLSALRKDATKPARVAFSVTGKGTPACRDSELIEYYYYRTDLCIIIIVTIRDGIDIIFRPV